MKRIMALTLSALALTATAENFEGGASKALKDVMPSVDAMATLPGTAFKAVQTDGQLMFMSENGRFVFTQATLYDTWNRRYLKSMAEVQNWSQRISMDRIGLDLDELGAIRYGSGEKKVTVWVDPNCPYCKMLLAQMPSLKEKYTFELLVVPFLGEKSASLVRRFACAMEKGTSDDELAQSLILADYSNLPAESWDCDTEHVEKLIITGRVMGVQGVPYIINYDGRFTGGLPRDLAAWLSQEEEGGV